jgi:hypothetical protein
MMARNEESLSEAYREKEKALVFETMELLVFEKDCINLSIQKRFSPTGTNCPDASRCGRCWSCNPSHGQDIISFDKDAVINILSANAFAGKTSISTEILALFKSNADTTWPRTDALRRAWNPKDSEYLLLQLMVSGIIDYECDPESHGGKQRRLRVDLFWGKSGGYPNCKMAYESRALWNKFGNVIRANSR